MRALTAATLLCLAASLAGPARPADAAFLSYNASFLGSGSLGQAGFTNRQITVSVVGNSDDRFVTQSGSANVYNLTKVSAFVTIDGVGTARITDSITLADFTGAASGFAFYDNTLGGPGVTAYLLYLNGPVFGNYDLSTTVPQSPVRATGGLGQNQTAGTTAGALAFRPTDFQVTFSVTDAVPEPSSLTLCGLAGAIGWAGGRGRRRLAGR